MIIDPGGCIKIYERKFGSDLSGQDFFFMFFEMVAPML
jgi:hypothetical protein